MYDVIIIGAGPAGVSASLYTERANKKTLIIHNDNGGLKKAQKIENYYGFENGIEGEELYQIGIKQAENIGVEVKKEEIIKIESANENFKVVTDLNIYEAKSIIIAIGTKRNKANIKGIKELEGKGISYCAICDGFFYRNKNVSVIGSGNYALSETNDLLPIANKITILTNGEKAPEFRADNVEVITKPIEKIEGKNKVEEVLFKDNTKIKTEGIFIAQGTAGSIELAKKIGLVTTDNGNIKVNEKMETNIKGIYACGDCTGDILQVSKAVYEGAVAGLEVIKYLKNK